MAGHWYKRSDGSPMYTIIGKNGEPDKTSGTDHQNDATTYPIAYEFPIVRPVAKVDFTFTN